MTPSTRFDSRIGLGHFTFLDHSPVELVRLARASGFGFVGLRFHPVAPGLPHWLPDAAGLAELGSVMAGEGIGLYDIETVVIDEGFDPESLVPALDAAARLGARRVNTCADLFPALPERFARVCTLAAEHGLAMDVECMTWRGVNTPAACLALIADAGAANAGYLVDMLHHARCGGTPDDIARMPPGLVRSVQVCDAPATAPKGSEALLAEARGGRLLPGEGALPLRDTLRVLPPDTVISVELPNASDPRDPLSRARAIHTATAALLRDL
ncbi:sugar phosphate isomerase/epimerase family protein [Paroceanicella profunda]|uniref:sugar phosphate isomerase/epimerase family protein n=1 Tax=Paroceanicella profunda TaxID=2579971 RepID=UPI0014796AD6|nr:TIM barrel protein [Paroceanicella profunda]